MSFEETAEKVISATVSEALKKLLSEKHIYQSIKCEYEPTMSSLVEHYVKADIRSSQTSLSNPKPRDAAVFKTIFRTLEIRAWYPSNGRPLVDAGVDILEQQNKKNQKFELPTIKTTCPSCEEKGPFNPVGALVEMGRDARDDQWFYFSYECQNCKEEPIRFFVRRESRKLTLVGREPFETVEVPGFIPKRHVKNLRSALVANHGGQTLAAIFLLRVFVEQFWRSIPGVISKIPAKGRFTGDDMGEAYKVTLPEDFKNRFPNLAEVYSDLSVLMHTANADAAGFDAAVAQVYRHFEARKLFGLTLQQVPEERPKD
jgi:hypothetical protein